MVAVQSQLLAFPAELRTKIALAPCQKRLRRTTDVQCKARRSSSQNHISHEPARNIVAPINASTAPSREVERQLYRLANDIALHYADTFHWSSFHAWDAVDRAKSKAQAFETDNFWDSLKSFGSCLGASTHIYHDLVSTLSNHTSPCVNKHAKTAKVMSCAQHATSETGYHAIVAMCFDTYAIVIDYPIHPTAFMVILEGEFVTHPYIPLFSDKGQERFKYFMKDSRYTLTMDSAIIDYPALSFMPMDVSATVNQLAIPAASQVKLLKGTHDIYLPPRKYVSVRTLLVEKPKFIPFVPLHGKILATALRLQISFEDAALLMQIPCADWLETRQGSSWVSKVSTFNSYVEKCEATIHVHVKLGARTNPLPTEHRQLQLSILSELAEEFGLDGKIIHEMPDAVFRVWAPYRDTENVSQT